MTASSPTSSASPVQQASNNHGRHLRHQNQTTGAQQQPPSAIQASCPSLNSSAAFQQVKQTQASLARLCRVHQQQQHQQQQHQSQHLHQTGSSTGPGSHSNQSSQQQIAKQSLDAGQQHQQKPTTFVDCLIRRFKNCFDDDFCTVPMFVVGGLSPGSDGNHLILPPCVSLGRQGINRFSGPKNLRLINSIRESCRSIEELDLGGNKLIDLIEVYKILQCMPNLRFLNLSENDLSRTSPVAMASSSNSSSNISGGTGFTPSITMMNNTGQQQCSSSPCNPRNYLVPISQNRQHPAIGARCHSSLGQASMSLISSRSPSSSSQSTIPIHQRTRQNTSRVAEARRLAAANALAQSKKTSPIVASKLASSAAASCTVSHQSSSSCRPIGARCEDLKIGDKQTKNSATQRLQASKSSTMHLARSLSSLSAKDIRVSSAGRLGTHRATARNDSSARNLPSPSDRRSSIGTTICDRKQKLSLSSQKTLSKITTSASHPKLYVEPIVESDDVDMNGGDQQASLSEQCSNLTFCNQPDSNSSTSQVTLQHVKSSQTGNSLKSYCNNNVSQLSLGVNNQSSNFRRTFESIKALALNNTGCQWKVVCSILSRMPNLEELHLSLNNYERIDLDTNEFKHHSLKRLYLCNNPKLSNWQELDKLLIAFPSLEALSIADCNISQIPDNLDRAREWRKLCGLNINGWPIKEWPVVERLNQLPSLIDLRCRNLEVLNTIDEPRHHLIARLPKLQRLNGSEIEEREDAEKAFIRFFMVNSHLERPSRFHELMQIYGEVPHIDVDVDLSPPSQARVRIIYLNRNHYRKAGEDDVLMSEDFLLKLMDNIDANSIATKNIGNDDSGQSQENMEISEVSNTASSTNETPPRNDTIDDHLGSGAVRLFKDEGQEVVALEVDLRQSVRKFKSTIASLFDLDSQNLILYYIDHEMVGLMGPELIKHNQKKLWNYNVQDGDQFIVEDR